MTGLLQLLVAAYSVESLVVIEISTRDSSEYKQQLTTAKVLVGQSWKASGATPNRVLDLLLHYTAQKVENHHAEFLIRHFGYTTKTICKKMPS